jgi:hypothetical protein
MLSDLWVLGPFNPACAENPKQNSRSDFLTDAFSPKANICSASLPHYTPKLKANASRAYLIYRQLLNIQCHHKEWKEWVGERTGSK